jgi:chemotaxis protein methyltransferase CheR
MSKAEETLAGDPRATMGAHHRGLGLNDAAVPLLRNLVHERTGIHFEDSRLDMLTDRIAPLVIERGFESFLDYYYLLRYDEASASEWRRVMDVLSVPETYFWRESDQIRAVVDLIVPSLAASLAGRPLRIWSAPCASGEEPLTIAMMLDQAGWFDRLPIEIHASDASPAAIARAKEGRYRERAFRSLPGALRERYFHRDGETWTPDCRLSSRITSWSVVNLIESQHVARYACAHVIFCRNVFIYFTEIGIRSVVACFGEHMPSPGYLCVGASESLLRITTAFELEEIGGAFVYVKRRL